MPSVPNSAQTNPILSLPSGVNIQPLLSPHTDPTLVDAGESLPSSALSAVPTKTTERILWDKYVNL